MTGKVKKKKNLLLLLIPLIFIFTLSFLFRERYFNCIRNDFALCVFSKKYISANGEFSFRYPKDYPISFKTGDELISQYNFDKQYSEWINFSKEFYLSAGGERLGSIIVEENTPYQSVKEFGDKRLSDFNNKSEEYKGAPPLIEYLKVGGENAVRITTSQQPSSFNPPSDEYILIYEGNLFRISFDYNDYYHKLAAEYYQRGKEVILSTFTLN